MARNDQLLSRPRSGPALNITTTVLKPQACPIRHIHINKFGGGTVAGAVMTTNDKPKQYDNYESLSCTDFTHEHGP